MVIVTPRFLALALLGIVPLAAAYRMPPVAWLTFAGDLLLLALLAVDLAAAPRLEATVDAVREIDDALPIGRDHEVALNVRNRTGRTQTVIVRDEPPGAFAIVGERQATLSLGPEQTQTLRYRITPPARGAYAFGDIYLRRVGPLGLAVRSGKLPAAAPIAVVPDIRKASAHALTVRRAQRVRRGLRRTRTPGDGREFASLREYTPDDEFRIIDWKATARRGKVISRVFEAERSQDVLLLIDQGRLMRQQIGYAEKMDSVVDAALALANAVCAADDRIGLLTFDETPKEWLAPQRGKAQVRAILEALHDIHAQIVESDYRAAFRALAVRWRKRSLLVLFTDIDDPEASAMLLAEIAHLARTHLVLCVTVRDPLLSERARRYPERPEQAFEKAVAADVLAERRRALGLLSQQGVLVVDAEPADVSADLVARYLAAKQRALL